MSSVISPYIKALLDARAQFESISNVHQLVSFKQEAEFARDLVKSAFIKAEKDRKKNKSSFGLNNCSPDSLKTAIINVAAVGITLNPALNLAYLVPRFDKKTGEVQCCLDISYQGLIQLAVETGAVQYVAVERVFQEDIDLGHFKYRGPLRAPLHEGCNPFSARGESIGVYCVAVLSEGREMVTCMDRRELNYIASLSKSGMWDGPHRGEMEKKSCVKRAYKMWPKPRDNRLASAFQILQSPGEVVADMKPDRLVDTDHTSKIEHDKPANMVNFMQQKAIAVP